MEKASHHSQSMTDRTNEKRRNKETRTPLPLFELVAHTPFKGSLVLDTGLLVSTSFADSIKLPKRFGEMSLHSKQFLFKEK